MHRLLAPSLLLLFAAGCDETIVGQYEQIEFTPTDCGMVYGCALSDDLSVGGEFTLRTQAVEGAALGDFDLQADDESVARVDRYLGNGEWSIVGTGEGATDLIAFDASGQVLDVVRIEVYEPTELTITGHGEESFRLRDGERSEWTATAGETVELDVRPARFGSELMGNMLYEAVVSSTMAASLDFDASPGEGRLRITADPGLHDALFYFGELRARIVLDVTAPAPDGESR